MSQTTTRVEIQVSAAYSWTPHAEVEITQYSHRNQAVIRVIAVREHGILGSRLLNGYARTICAGDVVYVNTFDDRGLPIVETPCECAARAFGGTANPHSPIAPLWVLSSEAALAAAR